MKKITKITPDQIARFPEWSRRWIEIGLSTEPADFDKATEAALRAYDLCNLKRPMVVLRMGSPYAATLGGIYAWMLLYTLSKNKNFQQQVESQVSEQVSEQVLEQVLEQVWEQVSEQVRSQVSEQVRSQVWEQVSEQVLEQVRSQVSEQVRSQVESQVSEQVSEQVLEQVSEQVLEQVSEQVRSQVESQLSSRVFSQVRSQVESQVEAEVFSQVFSQVWEQVSPPVSSQVLEPVSSQVRSPYFAGISNYRGGAFWAAWGAYVSFFRDVMGWDNLTLERFKIDEDLIKSCGWTWWHRNVLALSDRPLSIKRDGRGRLHAENRPSIEYRDGWALYHWHGVSVPREWIENKKSLTAQIALGQQNGEQRRAACEIVGWSKVLADLDAKTINRDEDPQIGELVEVTLPDNGPARFIRVLCGTGREFAIPVPLETKTALDGNCWTYDIPADLMIAKEHRT